MRTGDIILFKGEGITFKVLSFLIGIFDKDWRRRKWKPWHTAIAHSSETSHTWKIIDATDTGVGFNYLDLRRTDYRAYHWFDEPINVPYINRWLSNYKGKPYDRDAYLGTMIAYLWQKLTGKAFRIVDDQFHCWELVAQFCRDMDKPLQPMSEYPWLPSIIKQLEDAND